MKTMGLVLFGATVGFFAIPLGITFFGSAVGGHGVNIGAMIGAFVGIPFATVAGGIFGYILAQKL
jgi:hypothetical protein